MPEEQVIAIAEICTHLQVELSFIHSLQETGLIEVVTIQEAPCIKGDQLPLLEKYIDFHYTLDINLEGIETISHLLGQIEALQAERKTLKNRLQFYESVAGVEGAFE